jgi:hypothetical protein
LFAFFDPRRRLSGSGLAEDAGFAVRQEKGTEARKGSKKKQEKGTGIFSSPCFQCSWHPFRMPLDF